MERYYEQIKRFEKDPTISCKWCGAEFWECDCVERAFCPKVGSPGHHQCGWCKEHGMPRFLCLHAHEEDRFHK